MATWFWVISAWIGLSHHSNNTVERKCCQLKLFNRFRQMDFWFDDHLNELRNSIFPWFQYQ
jgi:hypothetical protein